MNVCSMNCSTFPYPILYLSQSIGRDTRYVWGGKKKTKIMFLIYLKISKEPGQEKDIRRTRALPGIIIYQQKKSIIPAFKVNFAHWGGGILIVHPIITIKMDLEQRSAPSAKIPDRVGNAQIVVGFSEYHTRQ